MEIFMEILKITVLGFFYFAVSTVLTETVSFEFAVLTVLAFIAAIVTLHADSR